MMSWTNDFQGCGHKWFRWGENKLTGEKTGGPMWGVVIMRITDNVKPVGESLLPVTPAAHQVVTDWRASKDGAAAAFIVRYFLRRVRAPLEYRIHVFLIVA